MNIYPYVGRANLTKLLRSGYSGTKIMQQADIISWLKDEQPTLDSQNQIVATFVIKEDGYLYISDRHSEHTVCAGGENVLSAGEITFEIEKGTIKVARITNQSTGYCPEPESWPAVEKALNRVTILHPGRFTTEFIFRKCVKCKNINIVKEKLFVCAICGSDLPAEWNCS